MKVQQIKFKKLKNNYSIIIGKNTLNLLPKKIRRICPKTKKIALVVDRNVPKKFLISLKKKFKKYNLLELKLNSNEKNKSMKTVNFLLEKLLSNNFNRSDLVIAVGGGITGDVTGFAASIFKRGINFINIPTTLLAQVDSAFGGKTGINSRFGKNLVGTFYQPKLVVTDILFINSLNTKEMICGYAEILKHAIIKDKNFFNWLKKNTNKILRKNTKSLIYAIKKSILIKSFFVNKDVNEKGLRMILNFGHTFAHAIEVKNNYSSKMSHGEAVLSGMMLETRISVIKKLCRKKTLLEIEKIYNDNNLRYTYKKFSKVRELNSLLSYLKHDKKNDDEKINFILLKTIGKTTLPNTQKISLNEIKKLALAISQG